MVFQFGSVIGALTFLSLIPLIIIYLIKPKPSLLKVPSLMFFMKNTKTSIVNSLFRYFYSDILFLLQLLVLLLLSFSLMQPLLTLKTDVVSDNLIFVFDISASSQVIEENGKTRFEIGKEKIKDLASSKNSLILMKSSPIVALKDASSGQLKNYLNGIKPSDGATDLGAAISFAGSLLADKTGRIVVVSDLVQSKGIDFQVAKAVVESKGIKVDFFDTKMSNRSNVGIVDAVISGDNVNLYVKNYNSIKSNINLKVNNDFHNLEVSPYSVEPFVFKMLDNNTRITIENKDDFLVDNNVTLVKPYSDSISVLWITNAPSKYIRSILNSINGLNVTLAQPPAVPNSGFDLYLISDLEKELVVVDTFGGVMRDVRDNGKSAIVVGQQDFSNFNFEELLPIKFGSLVDGGNSEVKTINKITRDVDFGSAVKVIDVKGNVENNLASINNESIISLFYIGKGKVVYYGLMEGFSDFKITPSYPVFWSNLIYFLIGKKDLNEINLKSGSSIVVGNETKILDRVGIYQFKEDILSVNLFNERESDINYVSKNSLIEHIEEELEKIRTDFKYNLSFYISILVVLLILIEFVYIKYRGEF